MSVVRKGSGGYSEQTPPVEHAVFLQTLLTVWAVGWDIVNGEVGERGWYLGPKEAGRCGGVTAGA